MFSIRISQSLTGQPLANSRTVTRFLNFNSGIVSIIPPQMLDTSAIQSAEEHYVTERIPYNIIVQLQSELIIDLSSNRYSKLN